MSKARWLLPAGNYAPSDDLSSHIMCVMLEIQTEYMFKIKKETPKSCEMFAYYIADLFRYDCILFMSFRSASTPGP